MIRVLVGQIRNIKNAVGNKKGTTFIIFRPNHTILMQLRDENSRLYPDMWCFPGGAADNGEDTIDTVIREAKEEFNLELEKESCKLIDVHLSVYDRSEMQYVYICEIASKQKPVLNEGAGMKWMTLSEIKKLKLGFGQNVVVPRLKNYLKN